jgi:tetratricopeptide (TPR) repeat protein
MNKFLKKTIWISLICFYFFQIEKVQAIIPYYYFPTIKNLQKQSLYIGKNAYQLLYFGQYEDSLNLAKLAVKINPKDEKLWLILAEAQIANKKYKNALNSLNKAPTLHLSTSQKQPDFPAPAPTVSTHAWAFRLRRHSLRPTSRPSSAPPKTKVP